MNSTLCSGERVMSSEVSVSVCGTWIHTRVEGLIDMPSALDFISEAAKMADDQSLNRFLFDVRSAFNAKSPFQDYDIANKHLRKLGFTFGSTVAILVRSGDTSHEFFELTAFNAGHPWRVFDDEEAAVAWLSQPEAAPTFPTES